jgi:hypothetical protein
VPTDELPSSHGRRPSRACRPLSGQCDCRRKWRCYVLLRPAHGLLTVLICFWPVYVSMQAVVLRALATHSWSAEMCASAAVCYLMLL